MKEVIEENTPVLLISGWMTLPTNADIPGNETELSVMSVDRYRTTPVFLFCTSRFTTFDCRNSFEFRMLCSIVRVSVYHVSIPRVESLSDTDDLYQVSWQVPNSSSVPHRIRVQIQIKIDIKILSPSSQTSIVRRSGHPNDELRLRNVGPHKRPRKNDTIDATQNASSHHSDEKKIQKRPKAKRKKK